MATFPSLIPQYSSREEVKQENQTIRLGDGFQQRLVFGLPANKRLMTLNLTFKTTTVGASNIETFLNSRFDDQESFDVTSAFVTAVIPHRSASPKFICTRRSRTNVALNVVVVNLTFQEVAEP